MKFGCAWYPEQWPVERWKHDLELMRRARMNVVRIGEFAWSRMEPEEGRYELDWLERAIAMAAEHGLETVIGTPTAAPPAWLTQRYPETLVVRENGRSDGHGNRCHFSVTSPRYREFCRRIAERLAERFGRDPRVIAWQIDNEYNGACYSKESQRRFEEYLEQSYGSLEALNHHFSAAYWSQTYSSFSQIPLPAGPHNPALMLHFRRFITEMFVEYQRAQIEAIRHHSSYPITHNFMGWFDLFDHYRLSEELDFASWDCYVGSGHLDHLSNGAPHDLTRGLKRKNFWLMETQPGHVNWQKVNNALDRGEVRAMAWHAIGHGADAVLYWQWRNALNGQEQYHGSLVGPDGEPRPLYSEIASLGEELARVKPLLEGTSLQTDVAILHGYDSRWALNFQRHHHEFEPGSYLLDFYRPLKKRLPTIDLISDRGPFAGYRLLVAPLLHVLPQAVADQLSDWVHGGGHLVLGARAGMKDEHNALHQSRQPGPLAQWLGAHVKEYYALDTPIPLEGGGEGKIWAEWLKPDCADVEVLLRYGRYNGWLDGEPAVVTRAVGRGRITYVGGWFDETTVDALVERWLAAGERPPIVAPAGVEVTRRVGPGRELFIVINHTRAPIEIALGRPMFERLAEVRQEERFTLAPRAVALLEA